MTSGATRRNEAEVVAISSSLSFGFPGSACERLARDLAAWHVAFFHTAAAVGLGVGVHQATAARCRGCC